MKWCKTQIEIDYDNAFYLMEDKGSFLVNEIRLGKGRYGQDRIELCTEDFGLVVSTGALAIDSGTKVLKTGTLPGNYKVECDFRRSCKLLSAITTH